MSGDLVRRFLFLFTLLRHRGWPLSLCIVFWTLRKQMFIKHGLSSGEDDIVLQTHELEVVATITNSEINHQLRFRRQFVLLNLGW